jgi:hypothetical protein
VTRAPRAIKKPLRKVEIGDYILRPSKSRDAATIRTWTASQISVIGALQAAAEHAESEDGTGFVIVGPNGAPVGVMTVEVPHLQFAFFLEGMRGKGVATVAAIALIDHYFASEQGESWLGDSGSLTSDGEIFVERLGFETTQLSREQWRVRRQDLLKRPRPA